MKKRYILPALRIVGFGGDICESIIIGSGNSDSSTGNGTDLVKEDIVTTQGRGYNVWDDNWSE